MARIFESLALFACLAVGPIVANAQSSPPVTPDIVAAAAAAAPVAPGPVQPTWDSVRESYRVPQWFIDAKFGITMHWGLFSVPAYHNEWYEKYMYTTFADWHAQHFGAQDRFGYKDFIPLFTAKDFNADDLLALVKASGAKYFMPTVEHHDGFSLWDSQVNPFNAARLGPHRDLVSEMAAATRKAGLKFGVASHNMEHYTFVNPTPGLKTDVDDPRYADFYWHDRNDARLQTFLEDWVLKSDELIDKYQPDIFWYDNGVNPRDYDPLKLKVAAYYYNRAQQWHKDVTFDTKGTAFLAGSVLDFEKLNPRGPTRTLTGVWDAEEPIGNTWGYSAGNPVETFRDAQSIIGELAEVVSMNGNFLLNLSPTGTGAITADQRRTLLEVGKWLQVNGEAIYGTHSWIIDGEGFSRLPPRGKAARTAAAIAAAAQEQGATANAALVDADASVTPNDIIYRFTVKGDLLYAIAQSWPKDGVAVIHSLALGKVGKVTRVSLLGHAGGLGFSQDEGGVKIVLPGDRPCDYAYAFRIEGVKTNPPGLPQPAVMADLK